MIGYWLGLSTSNNSCAAICGNCLINRDRATGMLICETLAAGLLGMIGPIFAVWLVMWCGGVNLGSIRPLFYADLLITIGPQYIFLFFVAIDLLIRLPLLISIPETLHVRFKPGSDRNSEKGSG
jgi:hypothetical protein